MKFVAAMVGRICSPISFGILREGFYEYTQT